MSDEQPMPFNPIWLDELDLTHTEFRVYMHILRRSNNGKNKCFASVINMAVFLRASKDTIRSAVNELEKRKMITVSHRKGQSSLILPNPKCGHPLTLDRVTPQPYVGSPPNPDQGHKGNIPKGSIPNGNIPKVGTDRDSPKIEKPSMPFDSKEFAEAVQDWLRHRVEIKKSLKPTAIKGFLKKCNRIGEARAIAAIEHSIANGWQGLHEPDNRQQSSAEPKRLKMNNRRSS